MGKIMRSFFLRIELECHGHDGQLLSLAIPKVYNRIADNLNKTWAQSGVKAYLSYPFF